MNERQYTLHGRLGAPQVTRDDRVELGTFMLQPGRHTISLTIVGKNRQSTDSLSASTA